MCTYRKSVGSSLVLICLIADFPQLRPALVDAAAWFREGVAEDLLNLISIINLICQVPQAFYRNM